MLETNRRHNTHDLVLHLSTQFLPQRSYKYKILVVNDFDYILDDKKTDRNLNSILKSIGVKPIKFHALKHTYSTRLFEANVPPKTVQILIGHSDISTTLYIYTHVIEDTKLEAIEKINEILIL